MAQNETPEVLPEWANQSLTLLWLLLLGGRWLLVPVLQLAGLLSAAQIAALDESLLLKLYLVLLTVTFVVVALRAVRTTQSGTPTALPADAGTNTNGDNLNFAPLAAIPEVAGAESIPAPLNQQIRNGVDDTRPVPDEPGEPIADAYAGGDEHP